MISLLFLAYAIQLCTSQERVTLCDNTYDFGKASSNILYSQAFLSKFNVTVITSGNTLHFLNSSNAKAFSSISLSTNTSCPYVYASEDFVIAGCYRNDGKAYLLRFTCTASSCKEFGQAAEFTVSINKIYKISQVANTLIVLQPDKVFLFKLSFTTTTWSISGLPQILDSEFFYRSQLNLTDFDVQLMEFTGDYQCKILILDQQQEIFWVDSVIRNNQLLPYIWGNLPHIYKLLIFHIDQDKKTILLYTNIGSDVENTYQFKTTYTLYSNKTTTTNVDIMNRYQNWKFIRQLPILDTFVAVPYLYNTEDKIRISLFVLQQYKMDIQKYQSIAQYMKSQLVGATVKDYTNCNYSENFFMYFNYRDNKIYLNYQDVDLNSHRVITQCELIGY